MSSIFFLKKKDYANIPLSWPFFLTHFLNSLESLKTISHGDTHSKLDSLWGNAATFDLFWYRDACLLVDLGLEPVHVEVLDDHHVSNFAKGRY